MEKMKKKIVCLLMSAALLITGAGATGNFASSDLALGTQRLLHDLTSFLTILCPVVGGLAAIICIARKAMSDEQDGKMWTKRMVVAIICGAGGALVSGIISTIASYY